MVEALMLFHLPATGFEGNPCGLPVCQSSLSQPDCHSERSEESLVSRMRILRCAQNDNRDYYNDYDVTQSLNMYIIPQNVTSRCASDQAYRRQSPKRDRSSWARCWHLIREL